MRLLAINFGGLGDEVLFLPTLKSIKQVHPDWEITLLTEPRSRSIAQLSSLIDKNIVFDIKKSPLTPADYIGLVSMLRAGKYDIVLSSGSSSKVCLLLFLTGIPRRIGFDSGALSKLLLSRAVALNKEQYAGNMYHDLVKGLDIELAAQSPQIDVSEQSIESMSKFLQAERSSAAVKKERKLVLIHPGTSKLALQKGIFKTWAADNWCELVKRLLLLDCEVLLCGGPDDEDTIRDITSKLGHLNGSLESSPTRGSEGGGLFINAFGKTASIKDLAALMHLADLIVCVDSAPMHMAAALQNRLVALFGPTDPKKLLLESDRAVAIAEAGASSKAALGSKGFANSQQQSSSQSNDGTASSSSAPSVQIPLDIVYQTVVDQLNRASVQGSSLEFHSR